MTLDLSLPPPVVPILKHVRALGVQRPVAAFPGSALLPGHLDEAVVKREVVANGVLPALLVIVVKGEAIHDELVDAAKRGALLRRVLNGHGDERNVTVRGLLRWVLASRHEAQSGGHHATTVSSVQVDERRSGEVQSGGWHAECRHTSAVERHDAEIEHTEMSAGGEALLSVSLVSLVLH